MTFKKIESMSQEMFKVFRDRGHFDRWRNVPFSKDECEAWKLGWREADRELREHSNAEV